MSELPPTIALQTTLADAASFLAREKVPYTLIDGLAVSIRGQPRVTADVDIVIAANVESALRLVTSLPSTPFIPLFQGVEDVVETAFILPLRHRTTNVKVDVALGMSGFEQQAISRARPVDIGGNTVLVATAEDLLVMKVLAVRPQDDQEVLGLVAAQGANLDWDYCQKIAETLGQEIGQDLSGKISSQRVSAKS